MNAEDYLRRVEFALRDLPWRMRRDLVSELRHHLAELPAEADLGSPERYVADLRSTAELERRSGPIAFLSARRPRNVILSAVALTVVGLAVGAVVWIQSYQPLSAAFGDIEPYDAVAAPAGGSASAVFHEGRLFRFGISVKNTGSFTVRVVGVPEAAALPFYARVMMSGPLKNYAVRGPYMRFHPFDLEPGQARLLFFEGTNCRPRLAGITMVEGGVAVRFSFLWRTVTTVVRVPEALAILVPKNARCAKQ